MVLGVNWTELTASLWSFGRVRACSCGSHNTKVSILPSVEAVIPPQVRLGSSEAVSQAGSSHLRAQAHLRHRSLDRVREDGSRLLHGRRRDIGAERIAQTRTSALA